MRGGGSASVIRISICKWTQGVPRLSVRSTAPERWMKVQGKVRAVGRLLTVPHSESTVSAEVSAHD